MIELQPRTVHVLRADVERPPLPIEAVAAVTSGAERARAARFRDPLDARRHLLGRGLTRIVLARILGAPPVSLELHETAAGKPYLEGGPGFSIAHSGRVVLVAFAVEGRIGVDVECIRPLPDVLRLARRSFGQEEVDALASLPAAERTPAFFRAWARREALLKALGRGLAARRTVAVSCATDAGDVLLRIDAPERLDAWSVRSFDCGEGVAAAVAWDRPLGRIDPFHLDAVSPGG